MPRSKPYSERFIAVKGLTEIVWYTVPAGKRAIVSNMVVYWSGTIGFNVYLQGPGGETIVFFGGTLADGPPLWYWWDGHMVFYEGETFTAAAFTEPVDVTVCGYLLTEPAV